MRLERGVAGLLPPQTPSRKAKRESERERKERERKRETKNMASSENEWLLQDAEDALEDPACQVPASLIN